mgnify:CR=1 FL=1
MSETVDTGEAVTESETGSHPLPQQIDPNPSLAGDEGHQEQTGFAGMREARDRYRTERDTAREELATAHARIEALQRAEVERLAAEHLAVPGDLWLSENAVADYLTESGDVDHDRVAEDAKLLLTERPRLGKNAPAYDPSQGLGGDKPLPKQPNWGALFS